MMNESNILTILFERKILKKEDNNIIYVYLPLEVVKGREYNFDGTKLLSVKTKYVKNITPQTIENVMDNEDTIEFNYIDDLANMNEKYVYGFSIIVDNLSNSKIKETMDYMIDDLEEVKTHSIFHTFNSRDGWNKLFVTAKDLNINVNPENYYELQDLMYGQLDGFDYDIKTLIENEKERISTPSFNLILPYKKRLYSDQIYDRVSKTVICQDEQIKKISTVIAKNSSLTIPSLKSNILVCGHTGVGKTEIFRSIHENFNMPVAFEDSNEYTASSFKGKDVTDMLVNLYNNADGDLESAERGILVIDEIDKKAGNEHETLTSAVINSFLKMMEGHIYRITVGKEEIEFDTSFLTFAFLGAFSGIEEFSNTRKNIGFMSNEEIEEQNKVTNIYTEEALRKYGLLPEFIGRCDTIVRMNDLTKDDLIKIMHASDKSQLNLYKEDFRQKGINFIYDDETIEAIARKAIELKKGARSIKKIVEEIVSDINYQIYSTKKFQELIITKETIEDNKKYILR